jgi:hypothetical protein
MNISEIHSTRKNHSLKQMLLVLAALTAPSVLSAGLLLVLDKGIDGQTKHTQIPQSWKSSHPLVRWEP